MRTSISTIMRMDGTYVKALINISRIITLKGNTRHLGKERRFSSTMSIGYENIFSINESRASSILHDAIRESFEFS
jgi:hypothetical protein